jgi:LEA14-like dessication related protein
MKKYSVVIGALVVGAFLYFRSKAKAGGNVKVYLNDLTLDQSKGFSIPNINARFKLVNPSSTSLTVDQISGEIYFNDYLVSNVQNLSTINIPANSEINYSIKIKTPAITLLMSIVNFFIDRKKSKSKKLKAKLTFKGTVSSMGITFPLEQTIYMQ